MIAEGTGVARGKRKKIKNNWEGENRFFKPISPHDYP